MIVNVTKRLYGEGGSFIGKDTQPVCEVKELTPQKKEEIMITLAEEMRDAEFIILKGDNTIEFVNSSAIESVHFTIEEEKNNDN